MVFEMRSFVYNLYRIIIITHNDMVFRVETTSLTSMRNYATTGYKNMPGQRSRRGIGPRIEE